MSLWWCNRCKEMAGFNFGICPKCGGSVVIATITLPRNKQ
jgi:rRNA maturation endonuclease Nob1